MNLRSIAIAAGLGLFLSSVAAGALGAAEGRTQRNSNGPVTVAVTPITVAPGEPLALKVVLDTHSVDLSAVALDQVVLVRTSAGLVGPTKLESAKGEGHHREAVLVFPASVVTPDLKTLEVLVKDVGGVPERRFAFALPLSAADAAPPATPSGSPGAGATAGRGRMGGQMMGGGHMMGGQMMGGQMMEMMQQMGTMMQQMGARLSAGQMSPEEQKSIGSLMQQMGGMMGQGMMGDMSAMQERMREMQQQMGEMPRMGQPMPSPK